MNGSTSSSEDNDRSSGRYVDDSYEGMDYQHVVLSEWRTCVVFFFVNPTSGGNAAACFTDAGLYKGYITVPTGDTEVDIKFRVYDIRDGEPGKKPGFLALKKALAKNENAIACACGGDGTVCWMTSEMAEHDIDDSNIAHAVIPYGTGNDFARAFLWEDYNAMKPFEKNFESLRNLFRDWFNGKLVLMDIWSIELELRPGGELLQVKSDATGQRKKMVHKDKDGIPLLRKEWKMFNYFSIGLDARIGIGFDRNRTTSQFHNKVVYLNEGTKKIMMRTIPIDEWVDEILDGDQTICGKNHDVKLKRHAMSLLASNVNSFAAGKDVWKSARRCGLTDKSGASNTQRQLMLAKQKMGDQLLEWLIFKHKVSLGLEQITPGHARRVHRGPGDFTVVMAQREKKDRCYFQVDGEFYQCQMPKTFKIKHCKQVKVLVNSTRVQDPKKFVEA